MNGQGNESTSDSLPGDSGMPPANIQSDVGDGTQSDVVDENTEIDTDASNVRAFSSYGQYRSSLPISDGTI
jgi:hypothetical protein